MSVVMIGGQFNGTGVDVVCVCWGGGGGSSV